MAVNKNTVSVLVAVIGVIGGWISAYIGNYDKLQRGNKLAGEAQTWSKLREGHYQWQWGKGAWLGDLSISRNYAGQACATVDISKYCGHSGASVGKVLTSLRCGGVEETGDGQPKLLIPVKHTFYDDQCKKTGEQDETLLIILNPKEAYTGSVDYIDGRGKTSTGGIAVINWDFRPLMDDKTTRSH